MVKTVFSRYIHLPYKYIKIIPDTPYIQNGHVRAVWLKRPHSITGLIPYFQISLWRRDHISSWLVGCFGFNGPLRQYFRLYRAVSQREGERGEKEQMREKRSKQPPPAPTASATGPCPTIIQISRTPRHWKFTQHLGTTGPPPDHISSSLSMRNCILLFVQRFSYSKNKKKINKKKRMFCWSQVPYLDSKKSVSNY